jgi:hypothetical protein
VIALRFMKATSWKLEFWAAERDAYSTFDKIQLIMSHRLTKEFLIVQLCRLERVTVLPSPPRVLLLACDSSMTPDFSVFSIRDKYSSDFSLL